MWMRSWDDVFFMSPVLENGTEPTVRMMIREEDAFLVTAIDLGMMILIKTR